MGPRNQAAAARIPVRLWRSAHTGMGGAAAIFSLILCRGPPE